MKKSRILLSLTCLATLFLLNGCTKSTPYCSGANQFEQQSIAPEGFKVVGKLWYHNVLPGEGDHMSENLQVFIGDHDPLPVNYGRDHVIRIGGGARYDVPVVFYVPFDYITSSVEQATLISNRSENKEFTFTIKGFGTVLVGPDQYDMPVDVTRSMSVWPERESDNF